jgi:hypothetical protein
MTYAFKYINSKWKPTRGVAPPEEDGKYEAVCVRSDGVRERGTVKVKDGKFKSVNVSLAIEEDNEMSERRDRAAAEAGREIIEDVPEHAEELQLTTYQQAWMDKVTTAERKFTMDYLRKQCPDIEDWLTVRIFSGVQEKFRGKNAGKKGSRPKYETKERGVFTLAKSVLLVGDVQSGKAKAKKSIALANRLAGISTIIIVRDLCKDAQLMLDGIVTFVNEFLEAAAADIGLEIVPMKGLYCTKENMENNEQMFMDAISGAEPCIMVAHANAVQLRTFNDLVEDVNDDHDMQVPFCMVVDEADKILYNDGESYAAVYEELRITTALAVSRTEVTATFMDNVSQNENLHANNVFYMQQPENYRGVNHITPGQDIRIIGEENVWIPENAKLPSSERDQFTNDPSIKPYYYNLTNMKPFTLRIQGNKKHPINVLHKGSTLTAHHRQMYSWISSDPVTKDVWSAIVFNGDDMTVYCPQLKGKEPKFAQAYDTKAKSGHFTCKKNVTIKDVYTELVDAKATHIVLVSGILTGRGQNIVNNTYTLQLTHQYYLPSPLTRVSDLLQAMRMLGVHTVTASLPMCLYTKESVWDDIRKGYWLQQDILKANKCNSVMYAKWLEEDACFDKMKMPKRKVSQLDYNPIRIAEEGEETTGMSMKKFNRKVGERVEVSREHIREKGSVSPVKGLTNKFKEWAKDRSDIGKFMKALNPEAMYTREELKNLTKEYGLSVKEVTKDSGHGKILERNGQGEYNLRPELVEAFKNNF